MREVRISVGVSDPNEEVVKPEGDHKTIPTDVGHDEEIKMIQWLAIITLIVLLIGVFLIWHCCRPERNDGKIRE